MSEVCQLEDDCPTPMWCKGKSECPKREAHVLGRPSGSAFRWTNPSEGEWVIPWPGHHDELAAVYRVETEDGFEFRWFIRGRMSKGVEETLTRAKAHAEFSLQNAEHGRSRGSDAR